MKFQISIIFIEENVVCTISAILFRPQCINPPTLPTQIFPYFECWTVLILQQWLYMYTQRISCIISVYTDAFNWDISRMILGLHPANERRRYFVTTSLIGWAQTQPCIWNFNCMYSADILETLFWIVTLLCWNVIYVSYHSPFLMRHLFLNFLTAVVCDLQNSGFCLIIVVLNCIVKVEINWSELNGSKKSPFPCN